jgi:hypothetical protein
VFDTLLDPWQLACTVLVIAIVLIAGRRWSIDAGDRAVGASGVEPESTSDTGTEPA